MHLNNDISPRDLGANLPAWRTDDLRHHGSPLDLSEVSYSGERNLITFSHDSSFSNLPIAKYTEKIGDLLERERKLVLTAPTGSGKSTLVPYHLMRRGHQVAVTEPRIVAALSLADWVSSQLGEIPGQSVAYRTSRYKADSRHSKLLYCTDGLQLVRETMGHRGRFNVLMIDEFHERNLNQDVLLAWAKRELVKDPSFKLIVASATVDAERVSRYLGGAAVVQAEGRTFPIIRRETCGSGYQDVANLVAEGRSVLVFDAGKPEIGQWITQLHRIGLSEKAVILPLHSELSLDAQRACFKIYDRPKVIVATNIAEASLTIPGINATVDTGRRRMILVVDGVQGLYTTWISLAERDQRMGRGGRTEPGIAIDLCPLPDERRERYPVPEILRSQLENIWLRVKANSGISPERLDFLDNPARQEWPRCRSSLYALGCIDSSNAVTDIGKRISQLPVSVNLGRMILEAVRENVLDQALKVAAIIEVGGIVNRKSNRWQRIFCPEEKRSDALAQLKVFDVAAELFALDRIDDLIDMSVNVRGIGKAIECYEELKRRIGPEVPMHKGHGRVSHRLIRCFIAGFRDHVYVNHGPGWVNGQSDTVRRLGNGSVVPLSSEYLVGIPWDLNKKVSGNEQHTLHLIKWASRISRLDVPPEIILRERELKRDSEQVEGHRRAPRGKFRQNFKRRH